MVMSSNLPKLPQTVGGEIDFMIDIKYLRYHPQPVFQLPSGLTIYKSMFRNADGGSGMIGGPHEIFTAIEKQFQLTSNHQSNFFSNQLTLYRHGYQINPDISMLGYKMCMFDVNNDVHEVMDRDVYIPKWIKTFNEAEEAGSEISYRCTKCINCQDCKDHDQIEAISIREEVEQDIINQSVVIDVNTRSTTANLPFTHDPKSKLAPNKHTKS